MSQTTRPEVMSKQFEDLDEDSLLALAGRFAKAFQAGKVIYMQGDLGAGKTTFTRGVLRGLGHEGAVKSPTYTLVEPYLDVKPTIYHFDLYRLADPEELEYMGIREYFDETSVCIIEWPDKGQGHISNPDIIVVLEKTAQNLRKITFSAYTDTAKEILMNI